MYTKTITKEVYTFEDLKTNEELRSKVINNLYYINIEHGFFAEYVKDSLNTFLDLINGGSTDNIYYNLDRGSYCSFQWSVDAQDMVIFLSDEDIISNEFGESHPFRQLFNKWRNEFQEFNKWAIFAIENEMVECSGSIDHGNRTEYTNYDYSYYAGANLSNELQIIAEFLEECCKDISEACLDMLREEYDYQTSDAAIMEAIEANEYEFDIDGNII